MTSKGKNIGPYKLGLDIGIASVGWATINDQRIIDLGVRCFDKAETPDKGESLNFARRSARLVRRRLRRRAWRLTKLARLMKKEGLISNINVLKQAPPKGFKTPSLWQLRVEALDRKLEPEEWARVLYHICKHRGFHWVSKAEEEQENNDKEAGAVKKGLAGTKRLMQENNYRTAAEMIINEFPEAQRNKHGEYSKALSRQLLADELTILFERQKQFGNPYVTEILEYRLLDRKTGLLWSQKAALAGDDLLKMLGKCSLEKTEYRAPKASFTAERHVWLTRLNNLRIIIDGEVRPLNAAERKFALLLPYKQVSDLSYKQLGNALVKEGFLQKDSYRFAGLAYPSARESEEEKAKNPETEKLIKLPGWQALHKAFNENNLNNEWQQISVAALDGQPQLLDAVARILSIYKEDEEVERELNQLDLPNKTAVTDALITTRFDKFSNLSLSALYKILPHMEKGLRYDEACDAAGYHHSLPDKNSEASTYLPPFYIGREKDGRLKFNDNLDVPRNPVVLRAFNQARKVVNALIKTYGQPPHEIHIEVARDLSRPFDERRKIKTAQDEYRDRNEKDRAAFNTEFNASGELKGRDFQKWQLYREQQGKCAYSLQAIDINRLFEIGYAEIDHALPYSRSFDDSKNNRVLVLTSENRNKGNMTPYEYLDGKSNSERWHKFTSYVESNKNYRQAKRDMLLKKNFGEKQAQEFSQRNLVDTRYICRFFKNYVEHFLKLHENSTAKRCVVVSGQLTSFLRTHWGLIKVRSGSDRHHALDAAVVAVCSHSMVKRLSDYSRRHELEKAYTGIIDIETGEIVNPAMLNQLEQNFPRPWEHFRQELLARLNQENPEQLRTEMEGLGYTEEALKHLRPLFISRAPQRLNSGAVHKETIYAQPERLKSQGSVTQKVKVTQLKLGDLDRLIDPHRNVKLYEALRVWIATHSDREKKAKQIEKMAKEANRELTAEEKNDIERLRALPRKPDSNGNPSGPVVRSVTMVIDKLSGISIRGGIAKNDAMLRVDVFTKAGKFYLVPVYVYHAVSKELPNRAATANTPRDQWTLIDSSYDFCFTLHPNDLIRLKNRKTDYFGYFVGVGVANASLSIKSHDNNQAVATGKAWQGKWVNLGLKTGIQCFQKFNVDVLGNYYPAPPEKRRKLA